MKNERIKNKLIKKELILLYRVCNSSLCCYHQSFTGLSQLAVLSQNYPSSAKKRSVGSGGKHKFFSFFSYLGSTVFKKNPFFKIKKYYCIVSRYLQHGSTKSMLFIFLKFVCPKVQFIRIVYTPVIYPHYPNLPPRDGKKCPQLQSNHVEKLQRPVA